MTLKRLLGLGLLAWLLAGCASTGNEGQAAPLRVGVMPDYPPIVYRQQGSVSGLEADFARQLAEDLHRPLEFHQYALADLFDALDKGQIDIIMSGISITPARSQRYLFSEPYATIGQMAMIRQDDAMRLAVPGALRSGRYPVGYKFGTTGEQFVKQQVNGQTRGFNSNTEAIQALMDGDIDFYVHDAPTVWNLSNRTEYPVKLLGLYKPLTEERLAWVMRQGDFQLQQQVNDALQGWRDNGFLRQEKLHWIPVKILSR
ncbi:amino acid ABC transporter periplasmic protein [Alcanivorax hongdengensis A-11-3]|uniref:Amino acid ABC transporter periplasmic protein n=1 Tax=Alcanivorax hongdengensis A-11-3 TaxID=1177179 RepID=L0WDR9_9GAMM|nr:ABC transporter substrate-binding protein [Alcanivorax hongdengensis]EKF74317.1 amino acid ABC transporter periplasmic protein [Alcanivorax hongdengensis A-11-3]